MIAASITAIVVLGAVLALVLVMHGWERREWQAERRALVDRAIARHSGEVIGLDRSAKTNGAPHEQRAPIEALE